ncbi:MAG: enoyl-CoA hydratase [Frankiales bacterium]|nr:enoyl-CoA hydratase [Frankiales bacterium]
MTEPVRLEITDRLARITLTRAETGNPLNAACVVALHEAIRAARDADVAVVLLTAEGRAFSYGGDLGAFAGVASMADYVDDLAEGLHRIVIELMRMPAIVVSVVQGTAAGAGLSLAAAADLVLAGRSAKFTLAYTKVGLSPDGGSSVLTASLGLHRMLHLALLNPVLGAEQAQAAGLVAQVHDDQDLAAAAETVVATLLAGSRSAQVAAKRVMREAATLHPETDMRRETLAIRASAGAPDGQEGVAAFVAKRPARFNQG